MKAVFCRNAADRRADTWAEHLAPWDRLEFAVSDAAKGIAKAVVDASAAPLRRPGCPGPGAWP